MAINTRRPDLWQDWSLDDRERPADAGRGSIRTGREGRDPAKGAVRPDWSIDNGKGPIADGGPTRFAQLGKVGATLVGGNRARPPIDAVIDPNDPRNQYFIGMSRKDAERKMREVERWLVDKNRDPKHPGYWSRDQVGFAISTLRKPSDREFNLDTAIAEADPRSKIRGLRKRTLWLSSQHSGHGRVDRA